MAQPMTGKGSSPRAISNAPISIFKETAKMTKKQTAATTAEATEAPATEATTERDPGGDSFAYATVEEAEEHAADDFAEEARALAAAYANEPTAEPTVPAAKAPKAAKPAKPTVAKSEPPTVVTKLAKVLEAQQSPTLWQFARLAKAVVQRTEAGQPAEDALAAILAQTSAIVRGILAQQPATSRDADVDGATRAYFAATAPKSLTRERGPKEQPTE